MRMEWLKKIPKAKIAGWVIALLTAVMGGDHIYKDHKYIHDNVYEELVEDMIAEFIQETFGLADDRLDDLIDLSPERPNADDCKPS